MFFYHYFFTEEDEEESDEEESDEDGAGKGKKTGSAKKSRTSVNISRSHLIRFFLCFLMFEISFKDNEIKCLRKFICSVLLSNAFLSLKFFNVFLSLLQNAK